MSFALGISCVPGWWAGKNAELSEITVKTHENTQNRQVTAFFCKKGRVLTRLYLFVRMAF